MANQAVKGFFSDLSTKIKSNQAINTYLDNISLSKHTKQQLQGRMKKHSSTLSDQMEAASLLEETKMANMLGELQGRAYKRSAGDSLRDNYKNYRDTIKDEQIALNVIHDNPLSDGVSNIKNNVLATRDLAKSYLGVGNYITDDQAYARYNTIVMGATMGGIGFRYLSGGNASTNSKGEKDIMGVPFI